MRGPSEESKVINKLQDQWCRDNGYPVRKKIIDYTRKNRTKKKLQVRALQSFRGMMESFNLGCYGGKPYSIIRTIQNHLIIVGVTYMSHL